jgi:hypothetical protein
VQAKGAEYLIPPYGQSLYNPSDGIPIPVGKNSPLAEAMEENKVVRERILKAIKPSRGSNSAKFGEVRRNSIIIEVLRLLSYLE